MIAGAIGHNADEIREAFGARGDKLDQYAPFNNISGSDCDPDDLLERAAAHMAKARSNGDIAEAAGDFATGMCEKETDVRLSPGYRFGFVAWLAHRGLKKTRARRVAAQETAVTL